MADLAEDRAVVGGHHPKAVWAWKQIDASKSTVMKWRKQAREADRFKAGKHFPREIEEELKNTDRPRASFNLAQKFIRYVSGLEQRSRQEVGFLPREIMDERLEMAAELVRKTFDWIIQESEGDSERSRAFEEGPLVRGMGWTDVTLDRSVDIAGLVKLTRVDGHEMWWDQQSRSDNLADARWVGRERDVDQDIALLMHPEHELAIRSSTGQASNASFDFSGGRDRLQMIDERHSHPVEGEMPGWGPPKKGQVRFMEFQWKELTTGAYFIDPFTQKEDWLEDDVFKEYKKRLTRMFQIDLQSERHLVWSYQRMLMCGRTVLAGPHRLPGKRFTFNCMTGEWDPEDGIWFGYLRMLMDPQKYLTKFVNQVMEIMTKQSKGGLYAEPEAFENPKQAEQQYAKTGSIVWLKPEAIPKQMFKEKQLPEMPEASLRMFELMARLLQDITGVSPDVAMGMGAADQPAMTMRQRQMASVALLAREFASLERYRRAEALTIFDFLQYIADDRIIRVGGQYDSQAIKLIRDPFLMKMDVVLDESTRDPNIRQEFMNTVKEIAPTLIRTNNFSTAILKFLPLPAAFRHALTQEIEQRAQQQQKMQQLGLGGGRGKSGGGIEENQARIGKMRADTALQYAKAQAAVQKIHEGKGRLMLESMIQQEQLRQADQRQRFDMAQAAMGQGQPTPPEGVTP